MEKGLYAEAKRDAHGKEIYLEKKLHGKGTGYIQRERGNNTEWREEIYTKTKRRPHVEGRGHTRGEYTREYAYK